MKYILWNMKVGCKSIGIKNKALVTKQQTDRISGTLQTIICNSMEYHDKEITSIAYQKEDATLTFTISNIRLVCKGVEWWELSSFDIQNVIFELNIYTNTNIPTYLIGEYSWVKNYQTKDTLKFIHIDSSVGMNGMIVASDIQEIHITTKDSI